MKRETLAGYNREALIDLVLAMQGTLDASLANQSVIENERQAGLASVQEALAKAKDEARRLALLNDLSQVLSRCRTQEEILQLLMEQANHIINADRISLAMLTPTGDKVQVMAYSGEEKTLAPGSIWPVKGTIIGETVRNQSITIVSDIGLSDCFDARWLHERGFQSAISAPLTGSDTMYGTLNATNREVNAFDDSAQRLLQQLASLLGSILENQHLQEKTRAALEALKISQQTVENEKALIQTLIDSS